MKRIYILLHFFIIRQYQEFRHVTVSLRYILKFLIVLPTIFLFYAPVFSQNKTETISLQTTAKVKKNKPPLNLDALWQWDILDPNVVSISSDGKFFTYGIEDADGTTDKKKLVVQASDRSWKKEFSSASPVMFSKDNKTFIFQHLDTLFFLNVGNTNSPHLITNVASYKIPQDNKGEWIACQLKDENKTFILKNLLTDKEFRYNSVSGYGFNNNGNCLVLQMNNGQQLQIVSFQSMQTTDIFKTTSGTVNSVTIDSKGEQVAFTVQDKKNGEPENSIWYYKEGMEKAVFKADNNTEGIDKYLYIQPSLEFSNGDRYIFFQLQYKQEILKPKEGFVKVNIWNYQDSLLQSFQVKNSEWQRSYAAALSIDEKQHFRVFRIEQDHQSLWCRQTKGDFVVVIDRTIEDKRGDRLWMPLGRDYYLVSIKDGSRKLLKQHGWSTFIFSPSNRYLIIYDDSLEKYFSYNLQSHILKNISNEIPKGWLTDKREINPKFLNDIAHYAVGIGGWLPNDAGILVYDNYDIWLLDMTGNSKPINLTAGYGRSHHIKFNIFENEEKNIKDIIYVDSILICAYDMKTKHNGFYQISVKKKGDPVLLSKGPYTYYHWNVLQFGNEIDRGMKPLKAATADIWFVNRHSFNEAPNYFLTRDFKSFQQLTEFNPQVNYNWFTAELVDFKQMDGTIGHGILYKPDNFDPKKKYPVLFNYYDDMTNRLYEFLIPGFTGDAIINIPWFVSHGYLVFTPDTYFTKYLPGPAAYNSVVGAAKWMAQKPFVDAKRMGIAGHSFGGGLTTYLVTHTAMFAAAFEGAGVSDLISSSLQIGVADGRSRLVNSGTTSYYPLLWQQPEPWLKNSPIMNADKVTTPLLMFHCRPDGAVPFEQAIEFYLALQRLGKKVWLLEYEDGNHNLWGKNAEDLTIRVTQYFDHYLKGVPAPKWMTKGIPANMKGIDDGLELDGHER